MPIPTGTNSLEQSF